MNRITTYPLIFFKYNIGRGSAVNYSRVKIMIVGEPSAGKTTLLSYFLDNQKRSKKRSSILLRKRNLSSSPPSVATDGISIKVLTLLFPSYSAFMKIEI